MLDNATIIVGDDGKIADLGPAEVMAAKYANTKFENDVDGTGKCVMPGVYFIVFMQYLYIGFVDAHTHSVYAGDRVHEFAMKLAVRFHTV